MLHLVSRYFTSAITLLAAFFVSDCGIADQTINADQIVKAGDRIVFLGDSNTFAGNYVADFDAMTRSAGKTFDVINVGLPSETCCGLSEPDHPFPRPTVQERIDRVLKKTKPDVVIACYGMNDGIYHPYSPERFEKYKSGIKELISKVKDSGAKLILLTPPPFDPLPFKKKKKLVGKDSEKFAWFLIYEDYDSVLEKYSKWILTLESEVDLVIDIRTPIQSFLNKKRQSDPSFTMSGDGVHFNGACHRIISNALLKKLLPKLERSKVDPKVAKHATQKMQVLRNAWLTETGHKRPNVVKGVPLDVAQSMAKKLDEQIAKIVEENESK